MKLFLTSSTITSNLVQPFEELIGKSIMNLNCAFIVDAMTGQVIYVDAGFTLK